MSLTLADRLYDETTEPAAVQDAQEAGPRR
jgi:hypothetical protein